MTVGGIELKVDKVSFSGGAPRFYYKHTLGGKLYAVSSSVEPLKVSASFMMTTSDRALINALFEKYRTGSEVEVDPGEGLEAIRGVISSLSWEDDGEVIRGRIEITQVDGVVAGDDYGT